MQDLKAAQAERLQGQLAAQQHSEICQLQERYQQVGCSAAHIRIAELAVTKGAATDQEWQIGSSGS